MKKKLLLPVIFIAFITNGLFAAFYNQRNLLIGERAAMMGGAYTALSNDNSAAFYNPAGLAFMEAVSLSLSANLYNYKVASRESDTQGGEKVKMTSLELIPTSFGLSIPFGGITLAFSIFQIDNFSFSGISVNGDGTVSKWDMLMLNYLIGPSISVKINENLSIGGSFFYHYFKGKLDWVNNPLDTGKDGGIQQNDIDSGGLTFLFGFKLNLFKSFHLGINYGSETLNMHGKNNYSFKYGSVQGKRENAKGDQRLPHRISLGIAYEEEKKFTIAFDFLYYLKLKYSYPNSLMKPYDPNYQYEEYAHFDLSIGTEVFLDDSVSLRFGLFTNTSGCPDASKSEKIHIYGGSFGLGYVEGTISSGIGIICTYGESDKNTSTIYNETVSWERLNISFIIGGSKKF